MGDISLVSPLEHKLASVLEFQASVKDKNGATPQVDTGKRQILFKEVWSYVIYSFFTPSNLT